MSKRRTRRPSSEQVAVIKAQQASQGEQVWGDPAALPANRQGRLTTAQHSAILKISIFEPWLRLVFGTFFLVFALSQRPSSWQFWLAMAVTAFTLGTAINGLLARSRLKHAQVEVIEGVLTEVRPQSANAVAATLHRESLYMFLLKEEHTTYPLPKAETAYRFYVVFGVIRPGIVVAIETLPNQ